MQEEAGGLSQLEPLVAVGTPAVVADIPVAAGSPAVAGSPDREGVGEAASSFCHNGF